MIAKALLTDWIPSAPPASSSSRGRPRARAGFGFTFAIRLNHSRCGHYAGPVTELANTSPSGPGERVVRLRKAGDLVFSNLIWFHHSETADPDLVTGRVHIDAADLHVKQQTRAVYKGIATALGEI